MFYFSRLAYPVYILEKVHQSLGSKSLLLFYDIACVLETHLRVSDYIYMYMFVYMYGGYEDSTYRITGDLTFSKGQHLVSLFFMFMGTVLFVRYIHVVCAFVLIVYVTRM